MRRNGVLALLAGLIVCPSAGAQTYPSQPIRFVVPASAGSVADTIARRLGDTMSKSMGQAVIVDNRPGANGRSRGASPPRRIHDPLRLSEHPVHQPCTVRQIAL